MKQLLIFVFGIIITCCTGNQETSRTFDIAHKFELEELTKDYAVMRTALEEAHPGIYRYTTKEKLDLLFDRLQTDFNTTMTEIEFFRFIAPVIVQIRCGHTGISQKKIYKIKTFSNNIKYN